MSNVERAGRPDRPDRQAQPAQGDTSERSDRPDRVDRRDRWSDRVELSLDGRQIFFLFFGSAALACLLFVSGVLVGRRIEQRAAVPVAGDDPLSALDELDSAEADDGLTFPTELTHAKRSARDNQARPAPRSSPRLDESHPTSPPAPGATSSPVPAPPPSVAPSPVPAAPRRDVLPVLPARREAPSAVTPAAPARPAGGRFTLQLSSFADRADAEAFATRVSAGGLAARVVESKVEGKGTFFRVRAGEYANRQAATEAKLEYDGTHADPAMVAPE